MIAPATSQLRFTRQGEVFSLREAWDTAETPSINGVMLAMTGMIPAPAGAIIFSGAGRDGCEGLQGLAAVGTEIWVQDPRSCEAPSMPQAALDAGLGALIATPEELAVNFMARYPKSWD